MHGRFFGRHLYFGKLSEQEDEKGGSKFIWVMDDSGNFYVDLHDQMMGIFHSSLMGGFRPIGAGELWVVDGYIVMLNEESGHYAPQGRLDIVTDELLNQGFVFHETTLNDSKRANNLSRVKKEQVRALIIERNKLAAGLKQENKIAASSWCQLL